MKLEGEQTLLRIFLRNTDQYHLHSAAEALLESAHVEGLAGATIVRGLFGLDCKGELLEGRSGWSIVDHVPLIVEIVDTPHAVGEFLGTVDQIVPEGLATLERAHVLVYRHNRRTIIKAAMRCGVPDRIPDLSNVPSPEEFPTMKFSKDGQQLRVFLGESDTWQNEPLYRAIVLKARDLGLAGATVLRGVIGYGATSHVHTSRLLEVSTDLPVVVEIVDSAEKIQALLPFLDESVLEGLITIEAVRILKYRRERKQA